MEEAGTQSIPQTEPAVFVQDSWQATPHLNVQYGLRWEAEIEPDPITPPDQVFYAGFIGKTSKGQEFPSNGKIPSDRKMWQPRFGLAWDPHGDGKQVLRANAGIYYGRVPGLNLASSRSTNGSRGQTIFRNSALTGILGPVPAYPNIIPQSQIGCSVRSRRLRVRQELPESADEIGQRVVGAGVREGLRLPGEVQLREGRAHHALRQSQRSSPRLAVVDRPRRRRRERHRRADDDRVDGQEPLQRHHPRHQQAAVEQPRSTR